MMLPVPDFAWRELAVLALFLWLLYRYTWLTLAATLIVVGLAALVLLPVDLYFSLPSLGAIGAGIGLLAHYFQQRRAARQRQMSTPRGYTQPHDEFNT
ncbi:MULTISPECIES: hypothetical protein [Pantoea]|jgi:hypothetical protein|uniref:Uncharacterized protein n=1 Tax=Pantoea piersonii TaxID=2364647 RepID=A0AAJ5QH81_9GAMM|nr:MULTISPECIES: hypothetical protein [Pantoea]MDU6433169.1 hypothetical protein [Pantoea sp.]MBZ6386150.1 hypothetical protein [Pantoea piersonii]MBZ6399615.1 hypothetical protein [Pantoea piersonii]MBZ6407106.1 hypothetical protein [Pantoea piersonii]MBZ6425787.1 hypothetical protein [Pantoea piersonii]